MMGVNVGTAPRKLVSMHALLKTAYEVIGDNLLWSPMMPKGAMIALSILFYSWPYSDLAFPNLRFSP